MAAVEGNGHLLTHRCVSLHDISDHAAGHALHLPPKAADKAR